jgi:hypothetical protein
LTWRRKRKPMRCRSERTMSSGEVFLLRMRDMFQERRSLVSLSRTLAFSTREKSFVFVVSPDPKPSVHPTSRTGQRSMMPVNSRRPKMVADLFKIQRWVRRILRPERELLVRLAPDWLGQTVIEVPEFRVRLRGHFRVILGKALDSPHQCRRRPRAENYRAGRPGLSRVRASRPRVAPRTLPTSAPVPDIQLQEGLEWHFGSAERSQRQDSELSMKNQYGSAGKA